MDLKGLPSSVVSPFPNKLEPRALRRFVGFQNLRIEPVLVKHLCEIDVRGESQQEEPLS